MEYNPDKHHRRSIRLKGYDYSQGGMYFITINVQDRKCLFGEIANGEMLLSEMGKIAYREWMLTPELRKNVELDAFVVMITKRAYAIRPHIDYNHHHKL